MKTTKEEKAANSAVATQSKKESAAAKELIETGTLVQVLGADFFGLVVGFITAGCTFEGMESAEEGLKDVVAYRSAKSTIRKAIKAGVKLLDDVGAPKSKGTLAKESKQTPIGEEGETVSTPQGIEPAFKLAEPRDVVKLALAMLNEVSDQGKAFREEFVADLYAASKAAQVELGERTTPARTGTEG